VRDAAAVAWFLIFVSLFAGRAVAQGDAEPSEQGQPSAETAIRGQLRRYVEAFNARDFETLSALLSSRFEYRDETSGDQIDDKAALVERIKSTTDSEPNSRLEARAERFEFQTETIARVTGTSILKAEGKPDEVSQFAVTMTRNDTDWKIASIVESAAESDHSVKRRQAMESLGWLVGSWEDVSSGETEQGKVQSIVEFLPGGQFLKRTLVELPGGKLLGSEIIGYDPNLNRVRSWIHFTDGTFGNGYWSGEDDHWRLKMTQTLADGRIASGTYIIRPQDANRLVVKVIAREIDGAPMPLGKETTMVRVEPVPQGDTDQPSVGEAE
jgi:hypothetical protein